jgi:class 3 adenylate cyclase
MTDDLATWLAQIGLGAHAARFISQGIDWDVLADLSECDLKELGLTLGDRKRLAKGLSGLTGAHVHASERLRARADLSSTSAGGAIEAERRQVTVMFIDLIDSTALAERFDPEDMRRLLDSYHQACARAIEAHEGHIALYIGDGLLVHLATQMRTKTTPHARYSARSPLLRRFATRTITSRPSTAYAFRCGSA